MTIVLLPSPPYTDTGQCRCAHEGSVLSKLLMPSAHVIACIAGSEPVAHELSHGETLIDHTFSAWLNPRPSPLCCDQTKSVAAHHWCTYFSQGCIKFDDVSWLQAVEGGC